MKLILFCSYYATGQSSTSSESSHSVMEHFSRMPRLISTLIRPQTSCTLLLKSTKPFTNFSIRLAECSYAYQRPFSSNRYACRASDDSSCRMSFGSIIFTFRFYFTISTSRTQRRLNLAVLSTAFDRYVFSLAQKKRVTPFSASYLHLVRARVLLEKLLS